MNKLHIDFETFSDLDIQDVGTFKYASHHSTRVLLMSYKLNQNKTICVDFTKGEGLSDYELSLLYDPNTIKVAHHATFERLIFWLVLGVYIPVEQWRCTMIHSAYCGLPMQLAEVGKVLNLKHQKEKEGKDLIKFFCNPNKSRKKNGGVIINAPCDHPTKWNAFINYNIEDVETEYELDNNLSCYPVPDNEYLIYQIDQRINDGGVLIDVPFVESAKELDDLYKANLKIETNELTGLDNSNSNKQLTEYLKDRTGEDITTLNAKAVKDLLKVVSDPDAITALKAKQELSKTSSSKYASILYSLCIDNRVRHMLQYYGAIRTGRWAGRIVQLHNLKRPDIVTDLFNTKLMILAKDTEYINMIYGNIANVISESIRASFIAPEGKTLGINDYSAIEARVIAKLANESWRLEVFKSHGKIYEASASKMFKVPLEAVTKDSEYRKKGKVAELALGYNGSSGAIEKMSPDTFTESEKRSIVKLWRVESPNICRLWFMMEDSAVLAIKTGRYVPVGDTGIGFSADANYLFMHLPSGRKLFYYQPKLIEGKYGNVNIEFTGVKNGSAIRDRTYGGKLTENAVQAISRDLIANAIVNVTLAGYKIVIHVHDEIVVELNDATAKEDLKTVQAIMNIVPEWFTGLPLKSDGELSKFYKK